MRNLFWLIVSGVLWLVLVQLSGYLNVPPQLISLARSGYIGTFSIFLLLELRRDREGDTGSHKPRAIYLYLAPIISVVILSIYSNDLSLTPWLILLMATFYLGQFILLYCRNYLGKMRSAAWDILPPLFLLVLSVNPWVATMVGILSLLALARIMFSREPSQPVKSGLDAIVIQLPSLCLAPAALVALRDVYDLNGAISRAHVETFGMIVNGVGAAIWTAVVMRPTARLDQWGVILWAMSAVCALALLSVEGAFLGSVLGILVAEGFRGAIWMATTHYLVKASRWTGFGINLILTALPFIALLVGRIYAPPIALMIVYAGVLAPVFLILLSGMPMKRFVYRGVR